MAEVEVERERDVWHLFRWRVVRRGRGGRVVRRA